MYAEVSTLYNVGRPTRLLCSMGMFREYNIYKGPKASTGKKGVTITEKFNGVSPLLAMEMIGPRLWTSGKAGKQGLPVQSEVYIYYNDWQVLNDSQGGLTHGEL